MPNLEAFKEKISGNLSPTLSANEIAEKIVMAALEVEFGRSFILSHQSRFTSARSFAKMVKSIAEAIVTNPDLRRQALHLARSLSEKP